ncbi:MAG: hypothetical protein L0Y54_23220, partial [Sporichthyaceae bacterium]|nr:hypothetical protein [Sporichthyaceae bacterium]
RTWLATHRRTTPAEDPEPAASTISPATAAIDDEPIPAWPHPPGVLPVGTLPSGEEHVLDIPAVGGLGLTGPGAPGLARYLLTTTLGAGAPTQHAHHTTVHITRADLELLGVDPPAGSLQRLQVADTLDHALGRAEADLLTRGRLLGAYQLPDVHQLRRDHPDEDPLAPVLLICTPGPNAVRVQEVLRLGAPRGIGGILLGPWPPGTTWHLAETEAKSQGGLAVPPPGLRPYTLTPNETSELLRLWKTSAAATNPIHPPLPTDSAETPPESAGYSLHAPEPGSNTAAEASQPVTLRLFGPPTLLINGAEITSGLRSLGRALLVYLALHRHGATPDAVHEALWPDQPDAKALNSTVSRVRALLRRHTGLAEAAFITHTGGRYRLDPDLIGVDVWAFTDTLADAPRTAGLEWAAALQAATDLYTGTFADGLGYEWAAAPAEDLRLQAAATLAELADLLEPTNPERAIAVLEHALQVDEYNEQLHQRAMRLQIRHRRPDAARRTYWHLEQRLYHLDLQPSPETERLRAELLGATNQPSDRPPTQ